MRCAVLGSPIAHSLSPALHRAAYAELGLDWSYEAVEVDAEGLEAFLDGLDGTWRGLSLTMPLKRTVVPLADSTDAWTRISGVANTVVLDDRGRLAFNTDIPGAIAALSERGVAGVGSAIVLGGGATATSVLLALAELGCSSARLLVRDPARAEESVVAVSAHPAAPEIAVGRLEDERSYDADILVSTIPAAAQTDAVVAAAGAVPVVFEVVYDSWPTPLARAVSQSMAQSGRVLVTGLDLLAHQAVLQLRLMTGQDAAVDVVREAGRAELARRGVQNPDAST